MEALIGALSVACQPMYLLYIAAGTLFGIFVGVMPGLSSVMGLSIMLPFTLTLKGSGGILMMLGLFCGAIYGGSITAILINTPGTANSAATCLDGNPMAIKKGQPGRALGLSTMASTFGGLFSAVMLLWTAPLLSKFAMKFTPPEYFAMAVFGLSIVTSVSNKNLLKGLLSAVIGLLLATIGIDSIAGTTRFTFGTIYLTGGISFIPVLIGLFAFSQGLITTEENFGKLVKKVTPKIKRTIPTMEDVKRVFPTMLRSSVIGTVIGAIPGTGGDIASWVSYNEAKRWSKHPEEFGNGAPEGIAAPEAANNAISGGALIPLLTIGIPGDSGTAVMLGALMMQGIIPGPLLFTEQTDKVYLIIVGLFLANIFMGLLGFAGIRLFSKIVAIPDVILTPMIFIFCFVGTFAMNHNISDIFLMIVAGVLGYFMLKMDFCVPPLILGLILGRTLESNLRRSLVLSDGSPVIFLQRPIAFVLLIAAFLSLIYPIVLPYIRKKGGKVEKM
ncbi:tripartite tricarboxylate transporter permease [[Clostridium] symbiosum]|uniref:tripartite tricarboxylate transporter permease n=1 Tax=Clostridium symbiosum TaxID=1512 RepID=UPI001D07F9BF|nr:tripartite tricarboxylate transporter permease [[Clostridium] symbiosum]MCB6609240.1 tripartite tricarboxylate transporter permease [[Clostridium] symbiosum]MCB6932796.1 tripartite tricarboxylate transporter permease [[Clostridium] symbiosum]